MTTLEGLRAYTPTYPPRMTRVNNVPARDFSAGDLSPSSLCSHDIMLAFRERRLERMERFQRHFGLRTALAQPGRYFAILNRMEAHAELAKTAFPSEKSNQLGKVLKENPGESEQALEAIGKSRAYWEGRLEQARFLLGNLKVEKPYVVEHPDDYRQGRSQAKWAHLMAMSGYWQGLDPLMPPPERA